MHSPTRVTSARAIGGSGGVVTARKSRTTAGARPLSVVALADESTSSMSSSTWTSSVSRRSSLLSVARGSLAVAISPLVSLLPAQALGFKKELKKRKIPESDYAECADCGGLRIYEVRGGGESSSSSSSSSSVALGDTVTVHFDVLYRGLDVASSRSARLLGANRTIAEPYSFVAGGAVTALAAKKAGESGGGGLYSGAGGPEPPPALSTAVVGMKVGDVRSALVPPEKGYGEKGLGEIPPGASFELRVEVLEIKKKA